MHAPPPLRQMFPWAEAAKLYHGKNREISARNEALPATRSPGRNLPKLNVIVYRQAPPSRLRLRDITIRRNSIIRWYQRRLWRGACLRMLFCARKIRLDRHGPAPLPINL